MPHASLSHTGDYGNSPLPNARLLPPCTLPSSHLTPQGRLKSHFTLSYNDPRSMSLKSICAVLFAAILCCFAASAKSGRTVRHHKIAVEDSSALPELLHD